MRIHRITFAALILGIGVVSLGLAALHTPYPNSAVVLHSGYSAAGGVGGLDGRSIQMSLERTTQGWTGWMMLDPNHQTYSEFGQLTETTLIAGERIDVTLTPFGEDGDTGRVSYLINQNRIDRTMYLVFPQHSGNTFRLVVRGHGHAATSVVFMEEEAGDVLVARK